MRKTFLATAGCLFLSPAIYAFNEPGNVLRDFEFNDPRGEWRAQGGVRGQIESFEGLAEPLFYLEGSGRGCLGQTFCVETQKWYVLSFRYMLVEDGNGDSMPKGAHDCKVSVAPGVVDTPFPPDEWGAMILGGTEKWAKARLFFRSGSATNASLNIAFRSGKWKIGRIYVREVAEYDRTEAALSDAHFEDTRPGDLPFEWRKTGEGEVTRLTFAEGGARSGRRTLAMDFLGVARLVTPSCAFVKQGDLARASVWVKASRRALVDFKMTSHSRVRQFNCHESQWLNPGRWTHFEVAGSPRCDNSGGFASVLFYLQAQGEDGEPTTLEMDDFSFSTQTPGLSQGDPLKPQLPNASFEQGPFGIGFGFTIHPTNVNDGVVRDVALDDTTSAEGCCSLKIRGDRFGFSSAPFRCDPDRRYTLSFWAKSTKPMTIEACYPYAAIGRFEIGPEWKRHSATAAPKREYLGPGYCYIRFRTEGMAKDNTLWLDGFQLDLGEEALPFRAEKCEVGATFRKTYKIFATGEGAPLDIRLANGGESPLAGEVSVTERNIRGQMERTWRIPAKVAPGGSFAHTLDYATTVPGYHRLETSFWSGGAILSSNVTTCAVLHKPKAVPYAESWAGMLGGFDNCGRNGSTDSMVSFMSGSWSEGLDALSLIGVKWLRTMAPGDWRNAEYPQGTYNWKWDDYLGEAKAHGMGVMVEFLGWDAPPWSHGRDVGRVLNGGFTYSMRPQDVEKFARDFASHYRGKVDSVNLLNETGGHDPLDFVELMEATYKGFKSADESIVVQGPGFPSSRFPLLVEEKGKETWIKRALDLGLNRWNDVFGIHPYDVGHPFALSSCLRKPFERAISDAAGAEGRTFYEYIAEQARRFKAQYENNRIWDSESGAIFNTAAPWQATPGEVRFDWYSERVAAARAIRCNLLRWSIGVERQFYFTFKFNLPYHVLDIMNKDMTPRAGVAALSTFYNVLDGGSFRKIEEQGDGTFVARFRGWKGEDILVYWNPDMEGTPDGEFSLPDGLRCERAVDMEGCEIVADGKLPLSCEPVYIYLAH